MKYVIVYNFYDAESDWLETNIHEDFEGSWGELQDEIKSIRKFGGFHIEANAVEEVC